MSEPLEVRKARATVEFFDAVTQGHEPLSECPAVTHDPPREVHDPLGDAESYGGHALGTDGGDQ